MPCRWENHSGGALAATAVLVQNGKQQAKAFRQDLPSDLSDKKPWTDFARCQGISTPRQKELLDIGFLTSWASRRSRQEPCSKRDIIEGLFVDVSQAIDRKPWGPLRTVCGGSQVYSYQKDRLLIPEELLRLLGFATSRWCHDANVSRAEVTALAGSGMALPSVSLVCLSLMLAAAESHKLDELFSYSSMDPESDAASSLDSIWWWYVLNPKRMEQGKLVFWHCHGICKFVCYLGEINFVDCVFFWKLHRSNDSHHLPQD